MRTKKKSFLGILLSLALVIGMMPVMGLSQPAYADTAYSDYLVNVDDDSDSLPNKVVHFNGFDWYIIADNSDSSTSGTVTLLAQGTAFGTAQFHDKRSAPDSYANSSVKGYLDSIIAGTAGTGKPDFSGVASAINDAGNGKLYLLSLEEADEVPNEVRKADFPMGEYQKGWWLRTPYNDDGYEYVKIVTGDYGFVDWFKPSYDKELGVRPALQLDLSKVEFDSTTKTFSVAADPVPYMAWNETDKKVSGTLMAKMIAKGKNKLALSWNKIKGAEGYDVFFAKCNSKGKENACKKVKSIEGNKTFKWSKAGLKKGTDYKAFVKAYVMKDGKKKYVSKSPLMRAYAGNGNKKFTNAKAVKVKMAKVTLKKGKAFKIKAKVAKVKKGKKLFPKKHVATVRYLSTNKKIATVSKSGKIKAAGKGNCVVYAYAHNGVSKKIKVTVK